MIKLFKLKQVLFVGALVIIALITSCEDDGSTGVGPEVIKPKIILLTPEDSSAGVDTAPEFTWQAASGSKVEGLTYDFYLGDDSVNLNRMPRLAEGLTEPKFKPEGFAFKKSTTYFWRVEASDGTVSEIWVFGSFLAPAKPPLVSPINEGFVKEKLVFNWSPVEAAPGEDLFYEVFFGEKNPPEEKIATVKNDTTYTFTDVSNLDNGKQYFWFVRSSDLVSGSKSNVRVLRKLEIGAPDAPFTIFPLDAQGARGDETKFEWTAVSDPDGVTYDLYLSDEFENPGTMVASNLTTNSFTTSALILGKPYWWKVVAKDGTGKSSESYVYSTSKLFPGAPDLPVLDPVGKEGILALDEVLRWSESKDLEGDNVTYEVRVSQASDFPLTDAVKVNFEAIEKLSFGTDSKNFSDVDIRDYPTYPVIKDNEKKFFISIAAIDESGNESSSTPVQIVPQMKGTFTDIRGTEEIEYDWVRVNDLIWLAENVQTLRFTDGTLINKLPDISDEKKRINKDTTFRRKDPYVAIREDDASDKHPETKKKFTDQFDDYGAELGRVYSFGAVSNEKFAPAGWHTMTREEAAALNTFVTITSGLGWDGVRHDSEKPGYWWNANNTDGELIDANPGRNELGLNWIGAGWKRASVGGWFINRDQNQGFHWTSTPVGAEDDIDAAFLVVSVNVNGAADGIGTTAGEGTFFENFGAFDLFATRLVKDYEVPKN